MSISRSYFGLTIEDGEAELFKLTNAAGMSAEISNYGGIVRSLLVPDRNGVFEDVALGFDTLEEYMLYSPYFGALIGRFGNRIARGRFTLDGKDYALASNEMPRRDTHLHGGVKGFDKRIWEAECAEDTLILRLVSPDGEEGYPGRLEVEALYTLTDDNALKLEFSAVCDRPTLVNLTTHGYFNLGGAGRDGAKKHELKINAAHFLPVNSSLIPTGEIRPVADTPFDFTASKAMDRDLGIDYEQLKLTGGYDHTFVLEKSGKGGAELAAEVYDPGSGRLMEVLTTQPGMQFYGGNYLSYFFDVHGKGGHHYPAFSGYCFEPQRFPDSPNHPEFPSAVLRPGEEYRETIIYRFSVR